MTRSALPLFDSLAQTPFRSGRAAQAEMTVRVDPAAPSVLEVRDQDTVTGRFQLQDHASLSRFCGATVAVEPADGTAADLDDGTLLTLAEAISALAPEVADLVLSPRLRASDAVRASGLVRPLADGRLWISVEGLWQNASRWMVPALCETVPLVHAMTQGRRHPLRRPKSPGVQYRRHIPWLNEEISFRLIDPVEDLERFHRWMNDPRVAVIWEEDGDLDKHRAFIEERLADPHVVPLIGCFDGQPFAYFEVYWARENRIGPYYDCQDFDRGWHVLVGEDAFRGKARVSAWLPSLMHYIFLDDPRTQRIVGEPAASHHQQLKNLQRSGFAMVKPFNFPHKRSMLVMLLRERFFADRLWAPGDQPAGLSFAEAVNAAE